MLLNSYEGFDYMDYSRYSMSAKDWGIVFIKSMSATVIIAYLFYDSPIVVIAFPVCLCIVLSYAGRRASENKRKN
jgi:tight adherence protein B